MKTIFATLMLLTGTVSAISQTNDQAEIKKIILEAYVMGLQNWGDLSKTREGFDPAFNLLIRGENNSLKAFSISDWIQNVEQKKKANPAGPDLETTVVYEFIDVTQNAAIAKIRLYKSDALVFTDYLSLYRFANGWRIVSKIYQKH